MQTPLYQAVSEAAEQAGFDRIGIAPANSDALDELRHFAPWVDSGYAGEMEYLKRRSESGAYKRSALEEALPWARSVLVAGMNYNPPAPMSTDPASSRQGWISRYAMAAGDYHDSVLAALRKVDAKSAEACANLGLPVTTRAYVDTGPLVERVYAKYAGIGWVGKNTCIIDQKLGSWMFLAIIVTSLERSAFLQDETPRLADDRCGSCTRCIAACPTQAIVAPRQLDASRCIAYFTIEKRGSIPEGFRAAIGRHVFGCDICQDVCPWNRKAPVASEEAFAPVEDLVNPDLGTLSRISKDEFRQRFRGSPISRSKHSGFLRNVAVAMGNSGERTFIPDLEKIGESEDPVVAEHAAWALERLQKS